MLYSLRLYKYPRSEVKDVTIFTTTTKIRAKGLAEIGYHSYNMVSRFTQFYLGLGPFGIELE